MPCEICNRKSEEIRDILRPFNLHLVEPVGGVKILAEWFAPALRLKERIKEVESARDAALNRAREAESKLAALTATINSVTEMLEGIL
jgi:hypothetical protein